METFRTNTEILPAFLEQKVRRKVQFVQSFVRIDRNSAETMRKFIHQGIWWSFGILHIGHLFQQKSFIIDVW